MAVLSAAAYARLAAYPGYGLSAMLAIRDGRTMARVTPGGITKLPLNINSVRYLPKAYVEAKCNCCISDLVWQFASSGGSNSMALTNLQASRKQCFGTGINAGCVSQNEVVVGSHLYQCCQHRQHKARPCKEVAAG